MENLQYKDITSGIIGAAMQVHRALGCGFQEVIYQRALAIELKRKGLTFEREIKIPIFYEGLSIGSRRVDFLVEKCICVELKAMTQLEEVQLAQAKNYLEAFKLDVGLLINFGAASLEFKRVERRKKTSPPTPSACSPATHIPASHPR